MNDKNKMNVENDQNKVEYDEIVEVSARKVECMIMLGILIALILMGCAFLFGLELGKSYAAG